VTIEGPDFSGKSTLVRAIKPLLADGQPATHFTREPGGTPAADRIREIVLDPSAGENVFCDRYLDSSIAYQGVGRGLGVEEVRVLNAYAVGTVVPDRTFYLRLGFRERERRARELGAPDRIEAVGPDFMRRVEEGFEDLARLEPERIEVLDASLAPEVLAQVVVGRISDLPYTRGDNA
jgi:dTMP kinase